MIKTAFSFITASFILLQLHTLPNFSWLLFAAPGAILCIKQGTRLLGVFLIALSCGIQHIEHKQQETMLATSLIKKDIMITGTISSIPEQQAGRIKFDFKPDKENIYVLPAQLRLSWYDPPQKTINADERWQLKVRLKPVHGLMNPGGFDYESLLFQQGIGATGYVRSASENKRLALAPSFAINHLRQQLIEQLQQALPNSDNIGLIQALTTGVRTQINQQQWRVLRNTGTSHLIAISGLHIGLIAAIGFFIFRWLWSLRSSNLLLIAAHKAAIVAGMTTALIYAALAGFSLPTQRALIMLLVLAITTLVKKPTTKSHVLATAAVVILLLDPLAIISAGFWLSFAAVAVILYISQNRFPPPQWQWLKIHALISLGLTPLLFVFFSQTSLLAPVANLIAVPVITLLVIPLLLVASLLLYFLEPIAFLLLQLADHIIRILWIYLDYLSALPYATWQVTTLSNAYWVLLVMATLLFMAPRAIPGKSLAPLALLPVFFSSSAKPDHGQYWFTLLDVGQGLSAVIETRHHTLLFDTGARFKGGFNSAKIAIAPFLHHQTIKTIDTLVVSHSDNDHRGGADFILNTFPVKQVLTSDITTLPNSQPCHAGQSWQWDGVTFTMLNPALNQSGSKNNRSCVLRVSNGKDSVLLAADVEKQAEDLLVQRFGNMLQSTVLVAPHHGSNTSSGEQFIKTVDADIVLFPTGYLNRYHFPTQKVVARYQKTGAQIFSSPSHGAIIIKTDNHKSLGITSWRQEKQKIWTRLATD